MDRIHPDRKRAYGRRLEQYLPRLDALASRVGGAPPAELAKQLAFSWTSPLSQRPDHFHTTEGLFVEQAMVRSCAGHAVHRRGVIYLWTHGMGYCGRVLRSAKPRHWGPTIERSCRWVLQIAGHAGDAFHANIGRISSTLWRCASG